jgi:hypothetical protein
VSTGQRAINDAADARETARAAAQDLAELAGSLPVPSHRSEACARICDRLAEDATELAAWLRKGSTMGSGLAASPDQALAELQHQWDGFYSVWFQSGEFHAMRRDNGAICHRPDPDELAREIQADYDALPVLR